MPVIDRSEVILDIFGRRAHTREARLQVELAKYEHALPRLTGAWGHLVRQGGGIGGRGEGESQLEQDRRRIRTHIDRLRKELEQVRLADELGFDYIWAVEHHFLEEYSHCSGPDIFLAAAATMTKRIRVGHGVVACVPQYQSPIRVAERAAVLDIISGGRLELGTGRSATWPGSRRARPARNARPASPNKCSSR